MDWLTICLIVFFGFFGLKTVFYDFPTHMDSSGFRGYAKNVLIIVGVLGAIFGYAYIMR